MEMTKRKYQLGDTVIVNGEHHLVRGLLFGSEYDAGPIIWRYFVQPSKLPALFPVERGNWVTSEELMPLPGKKAASKKGDDS